MSTSDRDARGDASKASFLLDLYETVNADPKLKGSESKLIQAYGSLMRPDRRSWLASSLARAKTGLSEAQVFNSRKKLIERGYLTADGASRRGITAFVLNNPRRDEMREHVALTTEFHRSRQAERQAARRAHQRAVSPQSNVTGTRLSQHPGKCDVSPNSGGNYTSYTPQYLALKKEGPSEVNGYVLARGDDPKLPFSPPETEDEAADMVMTILDGHPRRVVLQLFDHMREQLLTGRLSPATVTELLKRAA